MYRQPLLSLDFYWGEEGVGGGGRGVCTQAILWGSPEIRESYEYYHEYWNYEYFPEDVCPDCSYFYHHYFPSSHVCFFLPPMFASLYFYSFPNPPPPLPHFHYFPSTTTTITRNTTYLCNVVLCISLIINMKKQRRKIKNVVSPALIIQHANTNSDIICFIAKNCSLIFIC